MAGTPLSDELRKRAHDAAARLYDETPKRVWVEGDGRIYGDFTGGQERRRLTELDVIKLLHKANETANALISIL